MKCTFDFSSPPLLNFYSLSEISLPSARDYCDFPFSSDSLICFKVLFLSTMSFISDFAIIMGGSDYGGSIQQPLVKREVIPIGGSSLERTCQEAYDNESSSSERLVDSHRVGRGSSHLRRRARPSIASLDGEPFLVTTILPPSTSGGARRSRGEDVRVYPHNRCRQSTR